ncbi:hypothetical protein OS493_012337 [Desmophyllum pertusum]|uniref:PiggyBac transposable element-derived protein domain-containing protein n=1 Tax=Desmophyllum pertusum TaxID=174260 RepID=A0A9W9ZU37_9CNID|nr:hypothetical protein OS493_012337 [Desmophyllum pertusum]
MVSEGTGSKCAKCEAAETRRVSLQRKDNIMATAWKDKRLVHFLSSQSIPSELTQFRRKQRDGTFIKVQSTPCVKSYNANMGGVDLIDQLRVYYGSGEKI